MFIDNITWANDSFRLQAEKACGNNINCLFDAAVTEDTSYGVTTRKLEENNNQINKEFGKITLLLLLLFLSHIIKYCTSQYPAHLHCPINQVQPIRKCKKNCSMCFSVL